MEIIVTQEKSRVPVTIFEVSGFINLGTANLLEERARKAYKEGTRYLLLDLEGVESLSSAGLRTILAISKLLAKDQEETEKQIVEWGDKAKPEKSPYLKLLNPQPQIARVLHIAGFDDIVEIFEIRQDAVDSF